MRLRKIKMNKTGKRLILLAVIVAAGLALYANRSSFHFFSDGQKIFTMENGKNYQFFYYKDDILALNYDGVIAMNTSGDEEYTNYVRPWRSPVLISARTMRSITTVKGIRCLHIRRTGCV